MNKFFDRIRIILQAAVMAIFAFLILITIGQVFMRYVLNRPIMWADELTRLLMIWGTLLGCGLAIYYGNHINMDFLVEKLPATPRKIASALGWILIIGLSIFYMIKGSIIAFANKDTVLTALNISKIYYFGAIPVSALSWAIFSGQKLLETLGIVKHEEVTE
jgi:TRAP-type C4-dicarboxylate transport system permease small subunit